MLARASTREPPGPAGKAVQVRSLRRSSRQPADALSDGVEAEEARSALPRALRREVRHDSGGRIDAARVLGKRVDDAAAKREPPRLQGRRRDRQRPDLIDWRPGPEVPADENSLGGSDQTARGSGNIA